MAKDIRIRGVRRKEIDDEKLAFAFLLLAKVLDEQRQAAEKAERKQEGASDSDLAA